jgi:HAD superfamily hydrolase (TIGR01549 family)
MSAVPTVMIAAESSSGVGGLPRKPEGLAFDFDGTLADSVDYMANTWLKLARSMGVEPKVDVKELVGMTGSEIARILAGGDKVLLARITERRREAFDTQLYIRNVELFSDSIPVLGELRRRGYGMALASSTTTERIKTMASAFKVYTFFDVILGGDEVPRSKPAPDLIVEAASKLGVLTGELAYIGDTRYDVRASLEAGAIAVLVTRAQGEYNGPEPDLKVESLSELLNYM